MIGTMTALIWPAAALAITAMLTAAALKGWRGWLDLKRYEIAADRSSPEAQDGTSGVRIEMAAIKERLRRLEEIATGVDL
jgi:hypothetical protein